MSATVGELTKCFLDERFKNGLNEQNPLDTAVRLVQVYAKFVNKMWNQDGSVMRPIMFKRILANTRNNLRIRTT